MTEDQKACRTCKESFPATNEYFFNFSRSPDGLHPNCKWCCKVSRALEAVRRRDRKSKISIRQRVRAQGLNVEYDPDVNLAEVYKRARGICYICKRWVEPRHASMDHMLALTNGGTHVYDNIGLTHLTCNLKKGKKFII